MRVFSFIIWGGGGCTIMMNVICSILELAMSELYLNLSSPLFILSLIFSPSSTKIKVYHNIWHIPNVKDEMRLSGELPVFTLSSPIFRDWSPLSIFFLGFTNSSLHLVL